MKSVLILASLAVVALANPSLAADTAPKAEPVANGDPGTTAFTGDHMFKAFHGQAGVDRLVEDFVARNVADPRIADIFANQDLDNLRARLKEHFCFILGGGCTYTGKDMKTAHKDMGIQTANFNALVENLQTSMDKEGVAFRDQNRFLAKLAPMKRVVVTR